jgi:hypothetical protein
MILILTQSEAEANKLFVNLNSNGELGRYLKLSNIQFGPLTNPPLTQMFSLVIYYSMPKKIEQLLSQITLLNNNYIYQNYGKLRKLNVTHFHLMADVDDFISLRLQVFIKAISELQTERLVKELSTRSIKANQQGSPGKIAITFKEITKITELQPIGINRLVKQLQTDGIVKITQHRPCSFIFKPTAIGQDNSSVQSLIAASEIHNNCYRISLAKVSEVFGCHYTEALQQLKAKMTEDFLIFEPDDEELDLEVAESLNSRVSEISLAAYRTLRRQNILEGRLLQYLYLVLRIGSTATERVFSAGQVNKNMVSLLKNYALAEEASIQNLFPDNAVRDTMEPVRGDENQLQEAEFAFRQLLYRVEDFFPLELALCKDQEKGPAAREFIRIQMVRSVLELPGSRRPKLKLGSHHSNVDFKKIDFESLLGRSDVALTEYVSKTK